MRQLTYLKNLIFFVIFVALPVVNAAGMRVTKVTTLSAEGGRVDWSEDNRIAYDRRGADGYFDVYLSNPDGSGTRCLTCDKSALPGRHAGNPSFHPNSRYITFQAQKLFLGNNDLTDNAANPGAGYYNDVWIMDDGGTRFWRMTDVAALRGGGVLHPQFSHRGDKLIWAERVDNLPLETFGTWTLKLADFAIAADGTPTISNVRTYQPGTQARFYETSGFSPDDTQIIFSANADAGSALTGLDIYAFDYQTSVLTNLTKTPGQWDEHGHMSPAGNIMTWTSSSGIVIPPAIPRFVDLHLELWAMSQDGSAKERITFFNDPTWPFYQPGVQTISDYAWSPDGSKMVAFLVEDIPTTKGRTVVIDLAYDAISVNSASFAGLTLGRGSIVSVFGRGFTTAGNLAKFAVEATSAATSVPLPLTLAGSTVMLTDSAGAQFRLPLFFASPSQINLYLPPEIALGQATLTVRIGTRVVSTGNVQITATAPGVFTSNQDGKGAPLGFLVRVNADSSQTVTPLFQCPAPASCSPVPIDFGADQNLAIVLYGTGIRGSTNVTAALGATPVQVLFAGAQGSFVGLDQVNILLPRSVAGIGSVNLTLTAGGQTSNPVAITIR